MKSENIDLLNKVKDLLVKVANQQNINLQDEFGTVENFKKFTIAFTFKALTDVGVSVKDAYDMVLGDGEYEALFESVWNTAHN